MDNCGAIKDIEIGTYFLYRNKPVGVDYVDFDRKGDKDHVMLIISDVFEGGLEMIKLNKKELYEPIEIKIKNCKVEWFEEIEDHIIIKIDDNGTTREIKLVNINDDLVDDEFTRNQVYLVKRIKELFSRDYECLIKIKYWQDKEIIFEVGEMVYGKQRD